MLEGRPEGFLTSLGKKGKRELLAAAAALGVGAAGVEGVRQISKIDPIPVTDSMVELTAGALKQTASTEARLLEHVEAVLPDSDTGKLVGAVIQSEKVVLEKAKTLAERIEKEGLDYQP